MYDIIILAIGKIKEKNFSEVIDEYLKRLKPYARITVHELPFESFSDGQGARAKEVEGERILNFLSKQRGAKIIAMDEKGDSFGSVEFSRFLDGSLQFVFIIGGTAGLSQAVLDKAHHRIALSSMTFTHEMARLFLCEQIYRAVTINRGKKYHY